MPKKSSNSPTCYKDSPCSNTPSLRAKRCSPVINKTNHNWIASLSLAMTVLSVAALGLITSSSVNATESSSDLNLSVSPVISLSLFNCDHTSAESVILSIEPTSTGTFESTCQYVNVAANTPGYSLLVKSSSTDLLYQNPTPITPAPVVPSTNTGTIATPAALPNDTWGFAIQNHLNFDTAYAWNNANNKYALLPTTDQTIYQTDKAIGEIPAPLSAFQVYYGAKLTLATIAGDYKTTITYSAIGAEVPEPPGPPMQDFTTTECAAMEVYTNNNDDDRLLTLTDIRNGQEYLVGKLADGNCWMLNNLRISLTDVANSPDMTNSGIDTSVLATQTAPDNSNPNSIYYDQPRYYDPTCGATGGDPTNNGYECADTDINSDHFYGYLYNWCAAKGGTPQSCTTYSTYPTQTDIDICPTNWRMPTGGYNGDEEFYTLYNEYSGSSDAFQFTGPFRGTFAGRHDGPSWYSQGKHDFVWSASYFPNYSVDAFVLEFDPDGVFPDEDYNRSYGLPIRCLLR